MNAVAARSSLYGLLGECFAYPDEEFADSVRSGSLARRIAGLAGAIDPALLDGLDLASLADATATQHALAIEYTRLFDAGARGTGCALNGGLQVGPQMKVMEEAVRFYNHFGLALGEEQKELPDHLTTELDFLHFLSCGEHERGSRGESVDPYILAQRDFIARHPGRWVPVMHRKLESLGPMPLFLALSAVLQRLLQHELLRLEAAHGAASLKPSGELPFGGA